MDGHNANLANHLSGSLRGVGLNTLLALTASAALALPLLASNPPAASPSAPLDDIAQLDPDQKPLTQSEAMSDESERLEALYTIPPYSQVRIERRVVVRIAPASRAPRSNLMAEQSLPQRAPRFEERKMADCVAVKGIAGVRPGSGNRLVLYLQDRRMVSARLDKSCRARDFYSGFYIESNEDGMLCIARDKLQSRSGANCELTRMRELVAVEQ